jgi:hypothetical protein
VLLICGAYSIKLASKFNWRKSENKTVALSPVKQIPKFLESRNNKRYFKKNLDKRLNR